MGAGLVFLLAVPVVAAGILLLTLAALKNQKTAIAVPIGVAIGFVVIVASSVTLSAVARAVRPTTERQDRRDEEGDRDRGLTISQSAALLVSFVVLTAVPAGVIVAATSLLRRNNNLLPEFALPVILIVGLIGLLAVLAATVAVFRRFNLVEKSSPLGLPEGSIQAVIALGLILIFAIIGVYLHATAAPADKHDLSTQLLTTVSTLVVAVAGFYFGSKSTKEAADAVQRSRTGQDPAAQGEEQTTTEPGPSTVPDAPDAPANPAGPASPSADPPATG